MDPLVKAALTGNLEDSPERVTTETSFDAFRRSAISSGAKERELLLEAGARAIYHQAGYIPETMNLEETLPAEDMPACST